MARILVRGDSADEDLRVIAAEDASARGSLTPQRPGKYCAPAKRMGPLLGSGASLWGYAAFVVLALLGPGVGLQRALRIRVDTALVLPLGYAWTAASYLLSIAAHAP